MKRVICILSAICMGIMLLPVHARSAESHSQSRFSATFLQNWLCRDWTEERWLQEFSEAKTAGFDSLILQSVYDIVRGDCNGNGSKLDMSSYPAAKSFCMFPSEQFADYHSSQNGGDALALEAAKQTDMQLWLGTVSDDMWWKFGWGISEGQYFEAWSTSNSGICSDLIAEIWSRYGSEYRCSSR